MSVESYLYFTDAVVAEFGGAGSDSLLQVFEGLQNDQEEKDVEETAIASLFTEMLLRFETEELELDSIMTFLYTLINNDKTARVFCQVLNVFPSSDKVQKLLLLLSRKDNLLKTETIAKYVGADLLKLSGVVPKDVMTKTLNSTIRDEFYTQKKFNLLHEESEGYSKYISELYIIMKSEDSMYQLDYAVEILTKLVGHYSLDPNRCLDLTLEVFAATFVSKPKFVTEFLKRSRWWPSIESDNSSLLTLSKGGNESASKILGLKLLKHSGSDLSETTSNLTAYLIKEGFVSFGSIYNYLRPDETDMQQLGVAYTKNLEDEVFKAGANALALAAPLEEDEEDDSKASTKATDEKKETKIPSISLKNNFKYQILKVCLGNGLYWPSVFILSKYPFLAYINEDIHPLLCRMFNNMITPLYNQVKAISDEDLQSLQAAKKTPHSRQQHQITYEEVPVVDLYTFDPTIKNQSQKKFHYFDRAWASELPQVSTVDELFTSSNEFLKFVSVNLSKNVELFGKLCAIAVSDLTSISERAPAANETDTARKLNWFHYFRNYIFPALPLIQENSILIENAYKILSFYSLEDRFSVYGELYQLLAKNNLHVKIAYNRAEKSTKDILKRLSKENVRPMMRRLAKISFSNPLPCLLTILSQIESYDNLIGLVVETARYFNAYGWDSLTVAILMRLTTAGRSSTQVNGLNERKWLQSLATFIGKICQRYPNAIDLKTILTFLLKSFHQGENIGIIVLKEIFISMGGIQPMSNLTLHQINMINCGSVLEKLVYRTIDDSRFERSKSGITLVQTFLEIDAVNEFLVILCRLTSDLFNGSEQLPLKILTNKIDDLNTLNHLYTTLINFFGDSKDFETVLLSAPQLHNKFHVPVAWAFEIWRPILADKVKNESASALAGLIRDAPLLIPSEVEITPALYVTFWQLSLYDINYSPTIYESELVKLEPTLKRLRDSTREKDAPRAAAEATRKELKQIETFKEDIPKDKDSHLKHSEVILNRLLAESQSWFANLGSSHFLQSCILLRCIHSSFDAVYSSRFLFKLHELRTTNFSLVEILNDLIKSRILFGTLFTITPSEAENLGLFFADILRELSLLSKLSVFEKAGITENGAVIDFDRFREIVYEYHGTILEDLSIALNVKEYMARRNAITFLKNLLGVYPIVVEHCEKVVSLIESIAQDDTREDLKLSSYALIGHIKSKSSEWVEVWDFKLVNEEIKAAVLVERKKVKEAKELAIKELKEKQNKEREANLKKLKEQQDSKKLQQAINYEGQKAAKPRKDIRAVPPTSRGRYDVYSNYNSVQEEKVSVTPKQEIKKQVSEKPAAKDERVKVAAEVPEKLPAKKEESDDKKPVNSVDLKTRLLQAKRDYQEKAAKVESADLSAKPLANGAPSPLKESKDAKRDTREFKDSREKGYRNDRNDSRNDRSDFRNDRSDSRNDRNDSRNDRGDFKNERSDFKNDRNAPRGDRKDSKNDRNDSRSDRNDYSKNDRNDYSKNDRNDYSKNDRKDYSKNERSDYSKSERIDYSKTDRNDQRRTDAKFDNRNDTRNDSRGSNARDRNVRNDRNGRTDRNDRNERSDRPERNDRTDRRYPNSNFAKTPPAASPTVSAGVSNPASRIQSGRSTPAPRPSTQNMAPLPPPPPPPISLKPKSESFGGIPPRGRLDSYNSRDRDTRDKASGDTREKRDQPDSGVNNTNQTGAASGRRYDAKRKPDNYSSARGYDKKQRY